jgi:GNAT superfamily N-acetyltransferase
MERELPELVVRDATVDERAWANRLYETIDFAPSSIDDVQLIASRHGERIGLGRLVAVGDGALELGGIWTAESERGLGVAAAMVRALVARGGDATLWCVPFRELADYYARFGFAPRERGWPAGVEHKVAGCAARGQDVVVMARDASR